MTDLRSPSKPAPWMARPLVLGFVALAVLAAAVGLGVSLATRGPVFVDRITFENPTLYNLQVDVRPAGGAVVDIGTVPREGSRSFEQVLDQGEEWAFRLTFGGEDVGEVVVRRQQLEADGWQVRIPAGIGHRLADAGHPPSAF